MALVSVLLCTIDRFDMMRECVGRAVETAGAPFELLTVDNGSVDLRVPEYTAALNPVFHRVNPMNMGYARMMNQMMLRANGEYICVIDNDLLMPEDWLRKLVDAARALPGGGISGYHCVGPCGDIEVHNGVSIRVQEALHGCKFFHRRMLSRVGFYSEAFHPYGHEDVEYNQRSLMAGYFNYYLAGDTIVHKGDDVAEHTTYREMKWAAMRDTTDRVLAERLKYLTDTGDYYVAPPALS